MNATIERVFSRFRQKDAARQSKKELVAGRLLDGEAVPPEEAEAAGFKDEAELQSTMERVEKKRQRDKREADLQREADQYEQLRADYRAANAEHEELVRQRDEHVAAMRREIGQSSKRLDDFRLRIQAASDAKDKLRREFGS